MKPYSFLSVRNIDDCCHTSWYLSGLFYSENAMHCRLVCAMNEPTWFWCNFSMHMIEHLQHLHPMIYIYAAIRQLIVCRIWCGVEV